MPRKLPVRVRDAQALQRRLEESKRVVPHSVRSLASHVNSNRGTIGALLSGEQETLSEELAVGIAAALGVPFEDLFLPNVISIGNADSSSGNGSAKHANGARTSGGSIERPSSAAHAKGQTE